MVEGDYYERGKQLSWSTLYTHRDLYTLYTWGSLQGLRVFTLLSTTGFGSKPILI
jgi:hypothetical protein